MEDWFSSWFNSHYYHILYKNRDEKEAEFFMKNLLNYLDLDSNSLLVDMACGKGRHAHFLHNEGYQVLGMDLSSESIDFANQIKSEGLEFKVHDMRDGFSLEKEADTILNLFTSFGYFESIEEHEKVISNFADNLKLGGYFVFDFMNAHRVIKHLVATEIKTVDGIDFHIKRFVENKIIYKQIQFEDKGEYHKFQESVMGLFYSDFELMMNNCGLDIVASFGDFKLESFEPESSDRLILVAKKR